MCCQSGKGVQMQGQGHAATGRPQDGVYSTYLIAPVTNAVIHVLGNILVACCLRECSRPEIVLADVLLIWHPELYATLQACGCLCQDIGNLPSTCRAISNSTAAEWCATHCWWFEKIRQKSPLVASAGQQAASTSSAENFCCSSLTC